MIPPPPHIMSERGGNGMPSINEVIERAARLRPDCYDDETKAGWLIELDGKLYREVVLRHKLTNGQGLNGPLGGGCPECGGTEIEWDPELDVNTCKTCGWSELPSVPTAYPEDGDKPLLVGSPHDRLYELYLLAQADFYNREMDNYNNSVSAYNAAVDEWRQSYHRTHAPVSAGGFANLF